MLFESKKSKFEKTMEGNSVSLVGEVNSDIYQHKFPSNLFRDLLSKTNETIKGITENLENRLHFNTAISLLMELVNFMYLVDFSIILFEKHTLTTVALKEESI